MSSPAKIHRANSVITGNPNLEHLYTLARMPIFMGCIDTSPATDEFAPMSFSICKDSGIIQLDELLPLEKVYLAPHNDAQGALWVAHHEAFAAFVQQTGPQFLLELGGGAGRLARLYTEAVPTANWTIVEPSPLIEPSKRIKVHKAWFDAHFTFHEPLDAVVHSHMFEHHYYPLQFLSQVRSLLCPGAKHIFSIPNFTHLLERGYTNCLNFEHTIFLSHDVVEYLLQRTGFAIEARQEFRDHSVFYRCSACEPNPDVPLPHSYERHRSLFQQFVATHLSFVKSTNERLASQEHPAYLFGGHIFSQYLIGFGLKPELFAGVLDNSPLKQGKRLYGTHLKVFSPEILQKDVATVVVRACGFQSEVLAQIRSLNPRTEIIE